MRARASRAHHLHARLLHDPPQRPVIVHLEQREGAGERFPLAGGALVVQRRNADQAGLPGLRRMLETARARTVSVVLTG